MSSVSRFNVLGTAVSAFSLEEAAAFVREARGRRQLGYICHATAYNLNLARRHTALRQAYAGAKFVAPDGMPLVWLGRYHGHSHITRVYGPDLLLAACEAGLASGLRHYFYGGAPGVATDLATRLKTRFPGLQVAGTFTPPYRSLTEEELANFRGEIARLRPDIIWIGLSSPKQEVFMAETWRQLDAALLIGVGAAFDFHAGRVRQAPRWMQRSGLEWLHRLGTEPRRLWTRYLVHNPLFVLRTLAQLSGLKKYPVASPASVPTDAT